MFSSVELLPVIAAIRSTAHNKNHEGGLRFLSLSDPAPNSVRARKMIGIQNDCHIYLEDKRFVHTLKSVVVEPS